MSEINYYYYSPCHSVPSSRVRPLATSAVTILHLARSLASHGFMLNDNIPFTLFRVSSHLVLVFLAFSSQALHHSQSHVITTTYYQINIDGESVHSSDDLVRRAPNVPQTHGRMEPVEERKRLGDVSDDAPQGGAVEVACHRCDVVT